MRRMRELNDTTITTEPQGPRLSAADKHMRNSYLREFVPAIALFVILQLTIDFTVDSNTSGARLLVLLPVLPMIGVAIALYRAVQRADEYGRIMMLECMALGFGAAMITALALGFLGGVGVGSHSETPWEAWQFQQIWASVVPVVAAPPKAIPLSPLAE